MSDTAAETVDESEVILKMPHAAAEPKEDDEVSTVRSSAPSATSQSRARLEAAKTRLKYSKREVELKKQQAALEAELSLLSHEKEVAAAEAEVDALEAQYSSASSRHSSRSFRHSVKLPVGCNMERTAAYVSQHSRPPLEVTPYAASDLNPQAPPFKPLMPDWTSLLLKKELMLNRMSIFSDTPETYIAWRETFRNTVVQLSLSPAEEVDLLIKHLGPESSKQATSAKAANPRNPVRALERIWSRLDERYGAPEMVLTALQLRLNKFPKITPGYRDAGKLYELSDLLAEIEGLKEDPAYATPLAYFDSSAGVNPIVAKLPTGLQEKWTSHAVRHNELNGTHFPPFSELCRFMRQQSKIRNNPCYRYDTCTTDVAVKKPTVREHTTVAVKKTEVKEQESTDKKEAPRCPVHGTRHTLAACRGFQSMPLTDRLQILKKNKGCFKCCGLGHMRQECKATVKCQSCGSDCHPTALHVHGEEKQPKLPANELTVKAEEQVNAKCTQICRGGVVGKSCAKMVLVKVFPSGKPEKAVKLYVIIDDQSNRSLARSELFDKLGIGGEEQEYTLASCNGRSRVTGRLARNLVVESLDGVTCHNLPTLIECDDIPNSREEIPTPEVAQHYAHLRDVRTHINPIDDTAKILLLIGRDVPEAHHVIDQRTGPRSTPYAQRLSLGWVVVGESCLGKIHRPSKMIVKKTHILPNGRPSLFAPCPNSMEISNVFARGKDDEKPGTSQEDRDFMKMMEQELVKDGKGRWTAPLPFRSGRSRLPNNKSQALKRARMLASSLQRDPTKRAHFVTFMQQILDAGYAEPAPPLQLEEECWYLPIFGVYHPKKPSKIRVVFDSAAKYDGVSLNDVLLSGPDYTNNLLAILLRFRKEPIAVMADIQQMFFCYRVNKEHRDFLRFLWFRNNNPEEPLVEYRMNVHVFGNTCSPAVATYGLRRTASEGRNEFGTDVEEFIKQNFYVDDGLASLATSQDAIHLLSRTQKALLGGNMRLHKIASNSQEVMKAFPKEDLAGDLQDLDLDKDGAPIQRSLGVHWDIQADTFTFCTNTEDKKDTRRGVLATINSLYDPMGFLSPVTIEGKLQLRDLVSTTTDWDSPMPEEMLSQWQGWKASLTELHNLKVPRAYSASALPVHRRELIFADASEKGAYMKTVHASHV